MSTVATATATAEQERLATDGCNALALADHILAVTAEHRRMAGAHPAAVEAAILALQTPIVFKPIRTEDVFAGRVLYPAAGVSPQSGGFGVYCNDGLVADLLALPQLDDARRRALQDARAYWSERTSWAAAQRRITERDAWRTRPENDWASMTTWCGASLYRISGLNPDLPRLIGGGLPGLRADILVHRQGDAEAQALAEGWLSVLDSLDAVLVRYRDEAAGLDKFDLAASCERLRSQAPATLRDALQLAMILTGAANTLNFGRCDDTFGPLLEADLAAGRLDEDGAVQLVLGWFRLMATRRTIYNSRVILGGVGRKHVAAADHFARVALIATKLQRDIEPQVSLRLAEGQDPALLDLGLDALAAGCTYPMLYNDAVNVPAVMRAFKVDRALAESYVPFGCGEYVLGASSVGTPNGLLNIAHTLNEVLRGRAPGQDGRLPQYTRMDQVWEDVLRASQLILRDLAHIQKATYEAIEDTCRLLLPSLITDGPVERGRSLLGGGIRHLGGTMEVYGLANAADALVAIDQVVFRDRRCSLDQLRAALDADFHGPHAAIGAWLRRAPKYGNDDPVADLAYCRLHEIVCNTTRDLAPAAGLDSYLVVNINNWANAMFGRWTQATPDGRRAGIALSNANGPSSGNDHQGPSAVLASQAKPDSGLLAGQTQNLKLSAGWVRGDRANVKALLQQYFAAGGCQVMITISDSGELERAMAKPEEYGHVLVRVGGFSARFVDLPKESQLEILARTLH